MSSSSVACVGARARVAQQQRALALDGRLALAVGGTRARARRGRRTSRRRSRRHPDLDVAEARGRRAVRDVHHLARLALAAVRQAPQRATRSRAADRVQGPPELRRDPRVERVPVQLAQLAAADLARDLGRELELPAAVVDRPGAVGLQVQRAVLGVGDQVAPACPRRPARPTRWSSARSAGARSPRRGRSRRSASEADRGGRLAVAQRGAAARRRSISGVRAPGTPSSSQPNVPERAGDRRVGGDVQRARSRSAGRAPRSSGRDPARARVGRLAEQHAVELQRVADRLVQLQRELLGVQDDRARGPPGPRARSAARSPRWRRAARGRPGRGLRPAPSPRRRRSRRASTGRCGSAARRRRPRSPRSRRRTRSAPG